MKRMLKNKMISIVLSSILVVSLSALLGCGGDMYDEYSEEYDPYMMAEDEYEDEYEAYEDYEDYDEYVPEQEESYEDYYEGYFPGVRGCDPSIFGKHGSASEVEGTTVIVSIFANDLESCWTENDANLMYDMKNYLGIACDWITDQVASYGTNINFIYDWEQHEDLYYEADIDYTVLSGNDDERIGYGYECIDGTIDSNTIMSNYSADNIVYMIFINTPSDFDKTSFAATYYQDVEYPYEFCYIYAHIDGWKECPGGIAHEILHTFGTPDLYCADTDGYNCGVTEELVKYYEDTNSNDIMFTTYDCITDDAHYDKITNELSELDAYYIGITDHSDTVAEWGLSPSEHE